MKPPNFVDARYRAIELRSLTVLCNEWSDGVYSGKLSDVDWKRRLNNFRDAVISSGGKRQPVPSEILQADGEILKQMLERLLQRGQPRDDSPLPEIELVCREGTRALDIKFPAPFTSEMRTLTICTSRDRRRKPASTLKALLSLRYDQPLGTLRDALAAPSRLTLTQSQRIAIHFFSTLAIANERLTDQIRLLDALAATELKPIMLYYLVQHAQRVPHVAIPCPNQQNLDSLCDWMSQRCAGKFSVCARPPV